MKTKTQPKAEPRRKPRAKPKPARSGSRIPRNSGAPRSAVGYVREIQSALANGAYLQARELSARGAERFPKHVLLARYARVLAPPRVIGTSPATKTDLRANKQWIEANGSVYSGKWVALRDGTLLGAADFLKELTNALGIHRDILYTKVF